MVPRAPFVEFPRHHVTCLPPLAGHRATVPSPALAAQIAAVAGLKACGSGIELPEEVSELAALLPPRPQQARREGDAGDRAPRGCARNPSPAGKWREEMGTHRPRHRHGRVVLRYKPARPFTVCVCSSRYENCMLRELYFANIGSATPIVESALISREIIVPVRTVLHSRNPHTVNEFQLV